MIRIFSPKFLALTAAVVIALIAVTTRTCHARSTAIAKPASTAASLDKPDVVEAAPVPSAVASEEMQSGQENQRRDEKTPAQRSAVVRVHVKDIFGFMVPSVEAKLHVQGEIPVAMNRDEHGVLIGSLGFPDSALLNARIMCGDLYYPVQLTEGLNEARIPGPVGRDFGELAILPAEWEKVRVRRTGTSGDWHTPAAADPVLGRRFLFLHPGSYDISDFGARVAGTVKIVAGRRTTFTLTRTGAIRIELSFRDEPEPIPQSVSLRILARSSLAPDYDTWIIPMMLKSGQRSHVEYGLDPGIYEVSCDDAGYRFSETIYLKGGEVRRVNAVLAPGR